MRLAIILLAAGNSYRFGENKLLYQINGKPMYRWIVEKAVKLPADQVILVTQYDEICTQVKGLPIEVVRNLYPERGISSSIQLGIERAVRAEAYLFAVCDQPYLSLDTLKLLIRRYITSPKGITAVASNGKMGNPNIFCESYRDELLQLEGDNGGRQVIFNHPEDVEILYIEQGRDLIDIDYPLVDKKESDI